LAAFGSAGTPLVPSLSGYVDEKRIILGSSGGYSPRNDTELPLSKLQRSKKTKKRKKRNQEEDLLWKMLEPSKFVHDPKQHRRAIIRAS
jgi:hypothetical protein